MTISKRPSLSHTIEYCRAQADAGQICSHLQSCDQQFQPLLSSRVDIPDYAEKLHANSTTFEAWDDETLVGLVAAYIGTQSLPTEAFISNVSVLKAYCRQGIAGRLMESVHREAVGKRLSKVALQVSSGNDPAIRLYSALGYEVTEEQGDQISMELRFELDS